jgi:hypothetical protein
MHRRRFLLFFIIFQRHDFLPSSTDSSLSLSISLSASSPHSDKIEKAFRMPSISNSYQKCSLSTFARFESCCCSSWFPASPSNLLKQSPLPPLLPGKWKQAHRQVQHGPSKHSRPRNSFPQTWPSQNPGGKKGYLFLNPQGPGAEEAAPLIMTDDNELVWQGPAGLALGLRSQTYEGRPVLAYWNGSGFPDTLGRGYGAVTILDDSYEVIHLTLNESNDQKFVTFNGLTYPSYIVTKETFITDRNTMLVIATNITQTDLRPMGGAEDGWVVDDLIYEMDIKTNTILFRWSFLEHIADFPLNRSLFPFAGWGMNSSTAWNYCHMNSVAAVGNHYVVSSRYFYTVFYLDATGNVIWRLQVNHFPLSSHPSIH